jgi:hypothetical protein
MTATTAAHLDSRSMFQALDLAISKPRPPKSEQSERYSYLDLATKTSGSLLGKNVQHLDDNASDSPSRNWAIVSILNRAASAVFGVISSTYAEILNVYTRYENRISNTLTLLNGCGQLIESIVKYTTELWNILRTGAGQATPILSKIIDKIDTVVNAILPYSSLVGAAICTGSAIVKLWSACRNRSERANLLCETISLIGDATCHLGFAALAITNAAWNIGKHITHLATPLIWTGAILSIVRIAREIMNIVQDAKALHGERDLLERKIIKHRIKTQAVQVVINTITAISSIIFAAVPVSLPFALGGLGMANGGLKLYLWYQNKYKNPEHKKAA